MSKLRQHFQKCQAMTASVTADQQPEKTNNVYELTLAQLAQHKRALKNIQSIEAKIEAKRPMLAEYDGYLDGVLGADTGVQDDIVTTLMLWHIDCGSYDRALQLGSYAIAHDLAMPGDQKRTTAGAFAEEMADAYLKGNEDSKPTRQQIHEVLDIVTDKDMHDEIRAKLHKSIGMALVAESGEDEPNPDAVAHFQRAADLDDRSGVKNILTKLKKLVS